MAFEKYDYPFLDNFISAYLHQDAHLPDGDTHRRYSFVLKEFSSENGEESIRSLANEINEFRSHYSPEKYDEILNSHYPDALLLTSAKELFDTIFSFSGVKALEVSKGSKNSVRRKRAKSILLKKLDKLINEGPKYSPSPSYRLSPRMGNYEIKEVIIEINEPGSVKTSLQMVQYKAETKKSSSKRKNTLKR